MIVQLEDKDELAERFPGLIPSYEAGLRSAIAVPLVFKDRLIGTLQLAWLSSHAYSERHLRLAEGASAQIAGVLASSHLSGVAVGELGAGAILLPIVKNTFSNT